MTGLATILADIKLAHSVFALPFAAIGLLLGTRGQLPGLLLCAKIVAAMVLARSAAMAFNRLADARFDRSNPRTMGRALPSGRLTRRSMVLFFWVCALGFVAVAGTLGVACLALSPLVLVVLCSYSLAKRYTSLAHVSLGLALALAPPGAYLAARGSVDADVVTVLWFAAAVLLWVAGFDVIYACQDIEHDRREGLHALPARLGLGRALQVARVMHLGMLACMLLGARSLGLGWISGAGIGLVALLLLIEHRLVRADDLSRVGAAFFTVNGVLGLVFAAFVGTELSLRADQLWP
ncbi:MAG: 4-hydroxybenzoate octaprenyltransferase [Planctomycetota bacterium]|nr:MAG: 4-hydroxybenzoate octaprenyltransferase [Planctomycetota bacterium]